MTDARTRKKLGEVFWYTCIVSPEETFRHICLVVMKMGRRYKVPGKPAAYVERNKKGQFKDWSGIGRSIRADTARKAKRHPKKTGHGHEGDYPKR